MDVLKTTVSVQHSKDTHWWVREGSVALKLFSSVEGSTSDIHLVSVEANEDPTDTHLNKQTNKQCLALTDYTMM